MEMDYLVLHFVSYGSGLLVRAEYNVLGINLTKKNAGWKNSQFKRFPIFLGGRGGVSWCRSHSIDNEPIPPLIQT